MTDGAPGGREGVIARTRAGGGSQGLEGGERAKKGRAHPHQGTRDREEPQDRAPARAAARRRGRPGSGVTLGRPWSEGFMLASATPD